MQIQFMFNGTVVKATLENTPATRDLIAMLPLTVTLEDYASTEKIAYLKQPRSREGAPEGVEPRAGDVTDYAPWGNLALFQKDFAIRAGF